jgi:hypothetical protein
MSGLGSVYPLQIRWLGYSLSIPVIVIVMVALAEELPVLLATSLLEVLVSAIETAASLRASRINPASRIARMARTNDFLTRPLLKSIIPSARTWCGDSLEGILISFQYIVYGARRLSINPFAYLKLDKSQNCYLGVIASAAKKCTRITPSISD